MELPPTPPERERQIVKANDFNLDSTDVNPWVTIVWLEEGVIHHQTVRASKAYEMSHDINPEICKIFRGSLQPVQVCIHSYGLKNLEEE